MPTVLRAKCLIVGDTCVGKSAMAQVFHSDNTQFPKSYTITTGVELCTKIVTVPDTHTAVEFFLFDSPGKDVFIDAARKHWSGVNMLVIVYDVTNEDSFTSVEMWLDKVRSLKQFKPLPVVLVANKTDLDGRRMVDQKDGENLAMSKGLTYFECSAKDMQNVDQIFLHMAKTYQKMYESKVDFLSTLA